MGVASLPPGFSFVSDIAIFVLKRDVKLQLTNPDLVGGLRKAKVHWVILIG